MGEYEPNDSRNITGANNQPRGGKAGNEGTDNRSSNQTGQHWQSTDASISQSHQQGHGQDAGMRSQAQQQGSGGGGQMGGAEAHTRAAGDDGTASRAMGGSQSLAGQIREHMDVIGADGVHVGTVDHVDGGRIKLTRRDAGAGYEGGEHSGHHHYLSLGLVAGIEGDTVRLLANGDVAYGMEEEEGGDAT